MALAILKFLSIDNDRATFKIDTGTNSLYYFKIGDVITKRNGLTLLEDVKTQTSLKKNEKAGTLLQSSETVALPLHLFTKYSCYVQMVSVKNREGKSPAYSGVIKVPLSIANIGNDMGQSFSTSSTIIEMENTYLNPHRIVTQNGNGLLLSKQTSFDDILGAVLKIAGPIVMGLLSGIRNNPAMGADSATAAGSGTASPPVSMLNTILDAILNGLSNPAAAMPAQNASRSHSVAASFAQSRFAKPYSNANFSKPFIFGIDDALIASLAGPILQILPQLIGSNNAAKLQTRQANNQLITSLVADVNRRMMLQQFLQNQQDKASGSLPSGVNVEQLLQLLQQAAPTTAAVAPAITAPATTVAHSVAPAIAASLSTGNYVTTLSTTTILSFEMAGPKIFCEKETFVYQKNIPLKLKIKLNVTAPAPKTALPKAIVKIVFRDGTNKTQLEKIFKQKDVMPNTVLTFEFSAQELAGLPGNKPMLIVAEMKWLAGNNREIKSLGSAEVLFADNYFISHIAQEVQEEKELTDMKIYRAFWNKIWEPPLLDKLNADSDGYKKFIWELDANIKYTVNLSAEANSNGLMETKLLKAANELETLTEKTEGRIKGGIELSITELNKMCTLWNNQQPLPADKLSALKNDYFVQKNASEMVTKIKLKGKNDERGLVWIVPTLQLTNVVLNKIIKTDDNGQVLETQEETVLFPLPKSIRILGLKSI